MIRSLLILTACSSLTGCRDEPSVFNRLDANQDHRLSLTELEQGVTAGLFKTYDADQDRIITTIEWRKLDPEYQPGWRGRLCRSWKVGLRPSRNH